MYVVNLVAAVVCHHLMVVVAKLQVYAIGLVDNIHFQPMGYLTLGACAAGLR